MGHLRKKIGKYFIKKIRTASGLKNLNTRRYEGARVSRLFIDWITGGLSANSEIKGDLASLRNRSRELERNNPYARKYFDMCVDNTVGPHGIILQSKAMKRDELEDNKKKGSDNTLDTFANTKIEKAWKKWSKKGVCTVCGQHSWRSLQALIVRTLDRDGEVFIKYVRGAKNGFAFALQLIEADHIDIDYNRRDLKSGNRIVMGIEYNPYWRPVAYHVLTNHPGDDMAYSYSSKRYYRVPAEDMLHIYNPERVNQGRGVPALASGMVALKMLDDIHLATLTKAKIEASKAYFILQDKDSSPDDDDDGYMDIELGQIDRLNPGESIYETSSNTPSNNFEPFNKIMLRKISGAGNVNYNDLANDGQSINFSTIRSFALGQRRKFQTTQYGILIERFCEPVQAEWLAAALITELKSLDPGNYEKYLNGLKNIPPGFPWIDPKKDMEAAILAIQNGFRTRADVIAEYYGKDFMDVVNQLMKEKEILEAKGLSDPIEDTNKKGVNTDDEDKTT